MINSSSADLDLILDAAMEASGIAMDYFRRSPDITIKGDDSPVTEADLAIDTFLHDLLRTARPDYGWLSEERDDDGSRNRAKRSFVVDPIDGTRAFIAETAEWCISIGLVEAGRPIIGVLCCPVSNTVYSAVKGQGAYLGDFQGNGIGFSLLRGILHADRILGFDDLRLDVDFQHIEMLTRKLARLAPVHQPAERAGMHGQVAEHQVLGNR